MRVYLYLFIVLFSLSFVSGVPVGEPLLYLQFEDNVLDSSVYDRSVSGSISFADGKSGFGRAGSFDGVNYLNAGNWDIIGDQLTLAAWVNFALLDSNDMRFVSKASGSLAGDHLWMLGEGSNQWRSRINGQTLGPLGSFNANQWYHVATTYDGSTWKIFANGVEVNSQALSGNVQQNANLPVLIGANFGGYGIFNGLLDEVLVFDSVLSQAQIQDVMNNGYGVQCLIVFDVNCDGFVNLQDVGLFVDSFSRFRDGLFFDVRSDFNFDSRIDVLDLVLLMNYLQSPVIPFCGDGLCNNGEDYLSCSQDCELPGPVCGNNVCEVGEDYLSCSQDCDAPVVGAPQITGLLSGSFTHGSAVTIDGNNFGIKSPVAPQFYSNFENEGVDDEPFQELTATSRSTTYSPTIGSYAVDYGYNSKDSKCSPYYDNDYLRTSNNGNTMAAWAPFGQRFAAEQTIPSGACAYFKIGGTMAPTQEVFIDTWMALDTHGGPISRSFKMFRTWGNYGQLPESSFYYGHGCSGTDTGTANWRFTHNGAEVNNYFGGGIDEDGTWNHIQTWIKVVDPNTGGDNDIMHWYKDNQLINSVSDANYRDSTYADRYWTLSHLIDQDSPDVELIDACDNVVNNYDQWIDDAYIDITPARVEICNAATKSAASVCETQIPQNIWNNNQLQFKVNLGSFSSTNGLYLIVFNENNEPSQGVSLATLI